MFYSNFQIEELDNYLSFLNIKKSESIDEAGTLFIDLEKYLFRDFPQYNFSNHSFSLKELINRLDQLIKHIRQDAKSYIFVRMVDVLSSTSETLFWWSYYNHKFTESKGKDVDAMNKWHQLETSLTVDEVAAFKARRETNLAFYLELVKKHLCFTEVIFAGIDPEVKAKYEFGLDIAEEKYLLKMIEEHKAHRVCHILDQLNASPLLNFVRLELEKHEQSKVRVNVISNSEKLDSKLIDGYKKVLNYLDVEETDLASSNVILLFNDLDLLSALPFIDTENPIMVVDLSRPNSPNFGYILLKDDGFGQVYSYAKQRENEAPAGAVLRSLCEGVLSLLSSKVFTEQIAINYMDDYFSPLAKSHGKSLKEFSTPINMLIEKLEFDTNEEEQSGWQEAAEAGPEVIDAEIFPVETESKPIDEG